ncbi:Scr1 family TA system antitoxin-like transcriptional regulator [Streptomyces sulphureus]|uniref:Scr1 family TA system antitoxin-like transcriptional regulator n=1 Tax=Streptomyces sulphureus TaxID=47758 RepID=UPI000381FB44
MSAAFHGWGLCQTEFGQVAVVRVVQTKTKVNPPSWQRTFGQDVQRMREARGVSQEGLARAVGYSRTYVSKVESGTIMPSTRFAEGCDKVFNTGGLFATQLLRITEGQHVSWFAPYVDTEREASAVHDYSIAFIMGMLQTTEYARAVFERGPLLLSAEEIEARVAKRVQRREILQREEPARVWVVLHEACLRARIGSPWTMVEQLDHIRAELKRHPTLTVQVLPYESAAGATNIPFTVFENFESPPVVYVEGPQGARPYGADAVVSNAWQSLESLRACALGPHDSDLYIGTVRDEHARQAVGQVQLQRPDRRVRRVGPGSRVRGRRPRSGQ